MRVYQCVRHAPLGAVFPLFLDVGVRPLELEFRPRDLDDVIPVLQELLPVAQGVQCSAPRGFDWGECISQTCRGVFNRRLEIGWFQMKHIISALPEMDERPIKTKRQITLKGLGQRR